MPETVERDVLGRLAQLSPIRAIASVRVISGGLYKRAFSATGPASGWVAETAPRPQTAAPTLAELSFPAMELYAMPAATQTLLDDAVVDIDHWLAEEVEAAFAEQESAAFVTGDGVNKPKGFLAVPTVANASWIWGQLGFVATGAAGAFPAADPSDRLVDLVYALKAGYRQNAVFVMNRKTQSVDPQVQGRRRQLPVGAARRRGPARDPDGLPGGRGGGHARHRARTRSPSPSATSGAATWWSTGPASGCCAIPTRPSPTCCSTRPSASAAGCRTTTRSSS